MEPLTFDELSAAGVGITKTFQWEKKDLATYLLCARTLFTAALSLAEAHPDRAREYRRFTVMTSFNIASFCWPGWEDAHENITDEQRALAMEMCRYNVATAAELELQPGRRSAGYWMLGAHLLAHGEYTAAREAFQTGGSLSAEAESEDGQAMAEGWVLAADILAGNAGKRAELDEVIARLKTMGEDGEFYANQYAPALEAFS